MRDVLGTDAAVGPGRERTPDTIVVTMDSRTPTFRHKRYEQYKANRQKAPQDLHAQVPVIEEILGALGVPNPY